LLTDEDTKPFITEWRPAEVKRIIDGDTFDLEIDLGFDIWLATRVRLLGADTWEVRGEERELGKIASARVHELIPEGSSIRIRSFKGGTRGSFRRWLAEVAYRVDGGWQQLGEILIKEGHATEYK
jgi:micrococcal nuclease